MDPRHMQAAEALEAVARAVSEWTVDQHHEDDPTLEPRFGPDSRRLWRNDVQQRVAHLVEAIAADEPALFIASAAWSRAAFLARDMGEGDVLRNLDCLRAVIRENLPAHVADLACAILDEAKVAMRQVPGTPASPLERMGPAGNPARMFLLQLLQRDRAEAERIVQELMESNMPLAAIHEQVLAPAMNEIGHMWHMREASIADEHYCTASAQAILARLRGQARCTEPNGLLAVTCGSGGDMHELGIRMVSDLFEVSGWRVECLGSNMPSLDVAEAVSAQPHRGPADLLAVSAGTPLAVRSVANLITTVRDRVKSDLPVLVGGMPFHLAPGLWRKVGADGFAPTAGAAPEAALRLVRQRSSGAPA